MMRKIFLRNWYAESIFSHLLVLMEMFYYVFCATKEALLTCLNCLKDCISPIERRSFIVDTIHCFACSQLH